MCSWTNARNGNTNPDNSDQSSRRACRARNGSRGNGSNATGNATGNSNNPNDADGNSQSSKLEEEASLPHAEGKNLFSAPRKTVAVGLSSPCSVMDPIHHRLNSFAPLTDDDDDCAA